RKSSWLSIRGRKRLTFTTSSMLDLFSLPHPLPSGSGEHSADRPGPTSANVPIPSPRDPFPIVRPEPAEEEPIPLYSGGNVEAQRESRHTAPRKRPSDGQTLPASSA